MGLRALGQSFGLGLAVATALGLGGWSLRSQTFWIELLLGAWALAWVALVGLAALLRGRPREVPAVRGAGSRAAVVLGVGVFLLAIATCARVGLSLLDLPPGMHDEYSYVFQAKTYAMGRFWLPSQNAIPGLFDQIHVLNEGRFASRYFPGTGLWLVPFVALDEPYLGQWLAMGLAALLIFDAGRTIGGSGIGFVAGALVALAPGVAEFGNVLVAHAPTLLGLALFLSGFARARSTATPDRRRFAWGLASGAGLTLAMLCRPLTAAAVGLPFGLVLAADSLQGLRSANPVAAQATTPISESDTRRSPRPSAARQLVATGLPLVIGLLLLAAHDLSITGSVWQTPYGLYNEIYTPRHVYGFENGTRGDAAQTLKRDVDYDRWARNLTWPSALRNARARLKYSLHASIGAIPFAVGLVAVVAAAVAGRRGGGDFWLPCTAAIAVLHLAHLPYWFAGIHAYHYVFESIPLYALVFAGGVQTAGDCARASNRPLLAPIWALLALVPALWQWLPIDAPLQTRTGVELQRGTSFEASRRQHRDFEQLVEERVDVRPALVLVNQPPASFHVDYVVNPPKLDARVLFGRFEPTRMQIEAIASAFPKRALYVFDERRGRFDRIEPSGAKPRLP